MSSKGRSLRRAIERRSRWSARGDRCPICRRDFRSDECPHSVVEAHAALDARVSAAAADAIGATERVKP